MQNILNGMKECSKCRQVKAGSEFYKQARAKDGLQSNCKECAKAARSAWVKNSDKGKTYMDRNNARIRESDPDYWKDYHQKYYATQEGRDKYFEKAYARRAKILAVEGFFTRAEFRELCDLYGEMCLCCKRTDLPLEADHVVPISKGGGNSIANIQPLCGPCNRRKSARHEDYRQ